MSTKNTEVSKPRNNNNNNSSNNKKETQGVLNKPYIR